MIISGLMGIPFGMTEFFYVPEYWNPPTLFNLVEKVGFGLESILFAFFVGGISSVVFLTVFKNWNQGYVFSKKSFKYYVISYFAYIFLELVFPSTSIYNMTSVFIILSLYLCYKFHKFIPMVLLNGVMVSIVYSLLFSLFQFLFPNYISSIYTLNNFSGIWLFGLPIEEPFFAFGVGMFWAILYDITFQGNLTKNENNI